MKMPRSFLARYFVTGLAICFVLTAPAVAQSAGPRLALVIGNAQYAEPLATPANDAGLVAETLRGAGFDVTGAANLDQESLRRAFHDFLDKATQAGPNAIVFVYLAGRGLQYEGDNYFAPIDAVIARDADIPLQALRLSDYARALAALPLRARMLVLDAARANHFAQEGNLAGGLALIDADPGSLYAFNAAPGTIAPDEPGPYGAYAQALAELLRQGGVPIDIVFSQVRLRVNEATRGAVTPWDSSNITPPLALLEAAPGAPAAAVAQNYVTYQSRPVGSFPVSEAYAAALQRDTIQGYQEFLVAFPNDPLAARVGAVLAARREALTWRRACAANMPAAYWSYMRRYPHGPHFYDARRRLAFLSEPLEPPPRFDVYDFGGLPPPPVAEYEIVDRPVIIFETGIYPPPPPPVYLLPPPPVAFVDLAPPPPPPGPGFLPIPVPIPVPFGRYHGPQGTFNQPNFGQQGPVTPASAPVGAPGGRPSGASPAGGVAPGSAGIAPAGAPSHA
ncbi:MAG: caspase family protein, partial [Roseiarcus sp.]